MDGGQVIERVLFGFLLPAEQEGLALLDEKVGPAVAIKIAKRQARARRGRLLSSAGARSGLLIGLGGLATGPWLVGGQSHDAGAAGQHAEREQYGGKALELGDEHGFEGSFG